MMSMEIITVRVFVIASVIKIECIKYRSTQPLNVSAEYSPDTF